VSLRVPRASSLKAVGALGHSTVVKALCNHMRVKPQEWENIHTDIEAFLYQEILTMGAMEETDTTQEVDFCTLGMFIIGELIF
jgi:hypothetical protein